MWAIYLPASQHLPPVFIPRSFQEYEHNHPLTYHHLAAHSNSTITELLVTDTVAPEEARMVALNGLNLSEHTADAFWKVIPVTPVTPPPVSL